MQYVYKLCEARQKHQNGMVKVFLWSNVLLCFFIFIWMCMGLSFTGLDMFQFTNKSLNYMFASLGAFVILFWLIGCGLSIFGVKIATMESTGKAFPFIYGFFVFFLVMLPMFSQAGMITEL